MKVVPERQIRLSPPRHKQEEDSVELFQYRKRACIEKLLKKTTE